MCIYFLYISCKYLWNVIRKECWLISPRKQMPELLGDGSRAVPCLRGGGCPSSWPGLTTSSKHTQQATAVKAKSFHSLKSREALTWYNSLGYPGLCELGCPSLIATFQDKSPCDENVKYPEGAGAGHPVLTSHAAFFQTLHVIL